MITTITSIYYIFDYRENVVLSTRVYQSKLVCHLQTHPTYTSIEPLEVVNELQLQLTCCHVIPQRSM